MRFFGERKAYEDSTDAGLVLASLGGDRDAFAVIVRRYQSLLCSLAYSSVGDLKHSEDLAQEAFIEAWNKLDTLRDPEKLKSWLSGILRFKASHFHRKEMRQPARNAEEVEEQNAGTQADLEMQAIREQEELLLWETLEKLPENYRAPLVLFYREQCSVEVVAEKLDLSESTAKQRLSRGRKMLQEAMVAFVEDTLSKSKPGSVFTMAVMVSIANIAAPAKAAGFSAGVLKASSITKLTSLFVLFASFSGVISSFFSLRAGLDQSRTQRERRRIIVTIMLFFLFASFYVAGMFLLRFLAVNSPEYHIYYLIGSQVLAAVFVVSYLILIFYLVLKEGRLRATERELYPDAFQNPIDAPDSKVHVYRSRLTLFSIPLMHFKLGKPELGDKPAFAWIAGGDRAYGLLFAWGGIAVAPISVGILSVGIFSLGALSLGVLAMGTVCFGFISFGASAIGYKAFSSLSSLAWHSSISGGFAAAKKAAIGQVAYAKQVNNEAAAELAHLNLLNDNYLWVLAIMAIMVIIPAVWHSNKVRQRMKRR